MADDEFHEIQLSGKQLVFLFMATTVVSIVIFLCGVLVGRGVGMPQAAAADAGAAPRFAGGAESGRALPDPAGAPAAVPSALSEDLTYPDRLDGAEMAGEALRLDEEPRVVEEPPVIEEPRIVSDALPPAASPAASPAPPPTPVDSLATADGFTVQVAALRDRAEAEAMSRRLVARGYPAYVLDPALGAPAAVYRVRVGRYPDRRRAEEMMRRLEQEEQFTPWITR